MSDLTSRRVPADRGLSGLGLIMQLAGSVFAALTAAFGIVTLIEAADSHGRGEGNAVMWLLVVTGTGVVRSFLHRAAGHDLLYGQQQPMAGIRKYFVASLVNTVALLAFLGGEGHMPGSTLFPVVMMWMAWPLTLMVVANLPAYRDIQGQVPQAEDRGFEGASILMLIFGTLGLILTSLVLYAAWTSAGSAERSSGSFMLIIIALIVLVIRSGLHVSAGFGGIGERRVDQVVASVNRYCDFGVIASMIAGGCIFLAIMIQIQSAVVMAVIACAVWALLAWPLTLRRFFGERQFADLMEAFDAAPRHRRAPDLGLTTLGWLLLSQSIMGLAALLPSILMSTHGMERGPMGDFSSMFGGSNLGESPWWNVGLAGLQLWAAIELLRMGELHRIAASAYGLLTTVVTLYFSWPIISHIGEFAREVGMTMPLISLLAGLGFALTVPIVTLVVVNRSART